MKTLTTIILVVAVILSVVCLEAWIAMLLINWVIGLFGGTFTLTFWQAFGVCALLSFVGGFFKSSSKRN